MPGRYLWSVYEPESNDSDMTDERLTTLAKTELNKRNKSAISYEITSTDIHKHYPEMVVSCTTQYVLKIEISDHRFI